MMKREGTNNVRNGKGQGGVGKERPGKSGMGTKRETIGGETVRRVKWNERRRVDWVGDGGWMDRVGLEADSGVEGGWSEVGM
jgi:hypothetical protein